MMLNLEVEWRPVVGILRRSPLCRPNRTAVSWWAWDPLHRTPHRGLQWWHRPLALCIATGQKDAGHEGRRVFNYRHQSTKA